MDGAFLRVTSVLISTLVFTTGFLSVRVHSRRDRAIQRADDFGRRLRTTSVEGRPANPSDLGALERDFNEARNIDPVARWTLGMNGLVAAMVVGLSLAARVDAGWIWTLDPGRISTEAWSVLALNVVAVAVLALGIGDTLWVQADLKRRYSESLVGRFLEGARLLTAGENDAVDVFDDVIAEAPTFTWTYVNRAICFARTDRHEKALADLDKALSLDPEDIGALTNRGNVLANLGRLEDALTAHDTALGFASDYAMAHSNRGNVLVSLGRHEEAIEAFSKAIELDPSDDDLWHNRGRAYFEASRPVAALADFSKAVALAPNRVESYIGIGQALDRLGDLPGATQAYTAAIDLSDDNGDLFHDRAAVLAQDDRHETAIADFSRALDLGIDPPKTLSNRGLSRLALGDASGAVDDLSDALAATSEATETDVIAMIYANRSLARRKKGDTEGALDDAVESTRLAPHMIIGYKQAAEASMALGRFADAVSWYGQALDLEDSNGDRYELLVNRGIAHQEIPDFDRALADFDEAITTDPSRAEALHGRGIVLLHTGRHPEACESFDAAVAANPRLVEARVNWAACLMAFGRHQDALLQIDQAVGITPERADVILKRSAIRLACGDREGALSDFETARGLDPTTSPPDGLFGS